MPNADQAVRITRFSGAMTGAWQVLDIAAVFGDPLDRVPFVAVADDNAPQADAGWVLRGTASHVRYTTSDEREQLLPVQAGLGRPTATMAALIPIRKNAEWWMLAQDERRAIYARSQHLQIGMDYLPAVARKLYHSRDLGEAFDFLTWFEFAPRDEPAFNAMLVRLRASEEWDYIEREVDIRLQRVV